MTWSIGTPVVDGQHWLMIVGLMRYDKQWTLHLGLFWVGLAWE